MPLPVNVKIHCSQVKRPDYKRYREHSEVEPGAIDIARLEAAMRESVGDRISLANGFLKSAGRLMVGAPDEIDARNSVSRAYYCVHHVGRALLMFEERGDREGHAEVSNAFVTLVKNIGFLRSKLGDSGSFRTNLQGLIDHRHLADYYPSGASDPRETPLNFMDAAIDAINQARLIVDAVEEYIVNKEAGAI